MEIAIAPAKTEFCFLALSFGKRHLAHHALVPTDTHPPDLRDRRIAVDDVPALGRLAGHALVTAAAGGGGAEHIYIYIYMYIYIYIYIYIYALATATARIPSCR